MTGELDFNKSRDIKKNGVKTGRRLAVHEKKKKKKKKKRKQHAALQDAQIDIFIFFYLTFALIQKMK